MENLLRKVNKKSHPIYLVSEYGELLDIKPARRSKTYKTGKKDYREVRMIGDNTDVKNLYKWMNQNHNSYFLFDPKAHYTNSRTLYLSLKRMLNNKFYGYISAKEKQKMKERYGEDGFDASGNQINFADPDFKTKEFKRI